MKKVALITGGSRGIGFGIARELSLAGYDLAVNGIRKEEEVIEALNLLKESGGGVKYFRGDISREEDRQHVISEVVASFGTVNLLVNNAGVAPLARMDIMEASQESYDRVMDINLKGPYFFTQLMARHMVEQKEMDPNFPATIINVSSISATLASTNRGEYCISKAGVSMATRLWAVRLGVYGIPVFEIQPGIIETDMTKGVREKYDRLIAEGLTIQRRWGLPEDVGRVAVGMAEGHLPYSTGQVVVVDGGLSIPRL